MVDINIGESPFEFSTGGIAGVKLLPQENFSACQFVIEEGCSVMARYALDRFREFVKSEGFQSTFKLSEDGLKRVYEDDLALMKLSDRFTRQVMFAEESIETYGDAAEKHIQRRRKPRCCALRPSRRIHRGSKFLSAKKSQRQKERVCVAISIPAVVPYLYIYIGESGEGVSII